MEFVKKNSLFCLIALSLVYTAQSKHTVDSKQADSTQFPPMMIDHIDSIPDYYQRDPDFGGFPDNGAVYCGPTAASNALFWLARNGHSAIMKFGDNPKKDQHDLITRLASSEFINTSSGGSNPESVCHGIQEYLKYCGYNDAKIHFFGWRQVSSEYKADSDFPDFIRARKAIVENEAVLLNIGWYDFNERHNTYRRTGGHWVTMVGYGFNGKTTDPQCIIVHDPETRNRINDYITLELIENGTLTGRLKNLPREAAGYNRFKTGYKQYGVIEGMVIVQTGEVAKSLSLDEKIKIPKKALGKDSRIAELK